MTNSKGEFCFDAVALLLYILYYPISPMSHRKRNPQTIGEHSPLSVDFKSRLWFPK